VWSTNVQAVIAGSSWEGRVDKFALGNKTG
jgi:hypothetical protein